MPSIKSLARFYFNKKTSPDNRRGWVSLGSDADLIDLCYQTVAAFDPHVADHHSRVVLGNFCNHRHIIWWINSLPKSDVTETAEKRDDRSGFLIHILPRRAVCHYPQHLCGQFDQQHSGENRVTGEMAFAVAPPDCKTGHSASRTSVLIQRDNDGILKQEPAAGVR